jgi:DNA polymerase
MPETLVYLDGETRSRADIKTVGGYKYLRHESTELLCFCFAVDDDEPILNTWDRIPNSENHDDDFEYIQNLALDPTTIFVAHNAIFEQWWWQIHMVEKFGFPPIPIERWRCTMAKALSYGLPGALKNAAKALRLEHQKDMDGRENMLKLSKPRPTGKRKGEFYEYDDCPDDFEKMYLYCAQDVEVMRELNERLRDLSPKENKIWQIDQRMNQRGVLVDLPLIEKAISFIEREKEDALLDFQDAVNCDLRPSQRAKLQKWLGERGVQVDNTQATTLEKVLERDDLQNDVRIALELCTSGGKSATAKYQAMLDCADDDGVVRGYSIYHKASTGRFQHVKPQFQN